MNILEVRAAVNEAEGTLKAADSVAERLAELLTNNRLRLLSSYELRRLKLELRNFNIVTGRWNKK